MRSAELQLCRLDILVEISGFLLTILLPGAVLPGTLRAEPFCALTISVSNANGTPARNVAYELIDPNGRIEGHDLVKSSTIRICDFGFGAYSVKVGSNTCHPVTVSQLKLALGYPITLNVHLMNESHCRNYPQYHSGCKVYLRIQSATGEPIQGASAAINDSKSRGFSDEYGRLETSSNSGTVRAVVTADGLLPKTIAEPCQEGMDLDKQVTLERR